MEIRKKQKKRREKQKLNLNHTRARTTHARTHARTHTRAKKRNKNKKRQQPQKTMTTGKEKKSTILHENTNIKSRCFMKYKLKLCKSKQAKENHNKLLYILCQDVWQTKKTKVKEVSMWLSECLKCFPFECF